MNEMFSDDIIVNILSWLPLKEAARMRTVCKRWHALTSEHHFLRTSFSRNTGSCIAGFFLSNILHRKFRYVPLLQSVGDSDHVITPDLSFIPSTPAVDKGQIYVSGSCSGLLICCRPIIPLGNKSKWFVCNPLTRKFVEIEVPDGITHYLFLAYDPTKSRHYKVVAFGDYDIHMYSSQTRSWRVAIHLDDRSNYPFRGLRCYHSVFWNGSLVWVVRDHLVRFLVDDEQVVQVPMPRTPAGWFCSYIGESGGHLQMIGFTEEERLTGLLDVLEMQDGSSEWSVLYRVDLRRVVEQYPGIRKTRREFPYIGLRFSRGMGRKIEYLDLWPMYVVRGTEDVLMLFSVPGKIMCYSTESRNFSTIHGREPVAPGTDTYYEFSWYDFSPYNPSLFAP
ncbi:hypothetical protein QOZ80_2BG0193830 [Eleusine coracana subsp. coracana]|nr:hypothetical protein QOZ80_2BG0193830 [Eleusine coracana subsp. coracana]